MKRTDFHTVFSSMNIMKHQIDYRSLSLCEQGVDLLRYTKITIYQAQLLKEAFPFETHLIYILKLSKKNLQHL